MDTEYFKIPNSEIKNRIKKLQSYLKSNNFSGALVFSVPELYYYSGLGSDGVIYVPAESEPIHLINRNLNLAKQHSGLSNVKLYGRKSKLFETLNISHNSRLLTELDLLPNSKVHFLKKIAGDIELIDGTTVFRNLRSVKSDFEINLIEKAASLVDESFERCAEIARPDMTEIELALELDNWLVKNGHSGFITTRSPNSALLNYSYVISSNSTTLNIAFTPISGYGLSLKYPYGPSRRKLGHKPFFVDTCGNFMGYISDSTRTFILGKFDDQTMDELQSLQQIKQFLLNKLRPDTKLGDLFIEVMDLSKELGIYDGFMGTRSDKSLFLGHGIGLELDELPVFYARGPVLKLGNVIACEPKFIDVGSKVLGIEDSMVIKENSVKLLSKSPDFYEI
ncbi:MAG: M24 family metallopeptidase [Candidatus Hodarchaeales archaeon]